MTGILLLTGGVLAGLAAAPPEFEKEAMVRAVTKWDYECSGEPRGSWDDMAAAWYHELTNGAAPPFGHGGEHWDNTAFYSNSFLVFQPGLLQTQYIVDSDFTDKDLVSWGKDSTHYRLDDVDAAMVALHGGPLNGGWSGKVKRDEAGGGDCNAEQAHMAFGDVDLEFLHLSSCTSMQESQWHPAWSSSFQGVHQIDGFHGIMYIYNDTAWWDRYRDFAKDAYSTSMALAWLDNMYDYKCAVIAQDPILLQRKDQCPAARGVGVGPGGEADFWNRAMTERYDNVLDDPLHPTWQGVLTLLGCDPDGGGPIGGIDTGCDPFADGIPGGTGGGSDTTPSGGYAVQVDSALPAWDATILDAPAGPDWMRTLTMSQLAAAVSDTPPSGVVTSGGLSEASDGTRSFQTDRGRGRVRYTNQTRQFSYVGSPRVPWDETASRNLVLALAGQLGIPSPEYSQIYVDTVAGYGFPSSDPSSTPATTTLAERMVTLERRIHGLPVVESLVRAAVSNTGQIARLLVRWPNFRLRPGLTLRSRQEVVDEIVAHLDAVEGGQSLGLYVQLAYGRVGTDYLPVAMVRYTDARSGELLMVPLVGQAPDHDLDGRPDATDNCRETPNVDQADADTDGVGDACDNCPATANSGQLDTDRDGTGDACELPRGACLLSFGPCDVVTPAMCQASGGLYQGAGTTCAGVAQPDLELERTRLVWTATPLSSGYDVVRGDLGLLRSSGGDFSLATLQCLFNDGAATSLAYAPNPAPGQGWFFLVRQQSAGPFDSYDSGGTGQIESRDAEIAASGHDCP
ncbi:MAG TPA: DUF6345 domain-containing protein [Candidatus Polarisedimenticolaceae bacterium]|nr:DUF6345 domain-containing protein [Candidatus Polarisedimenticolaceae bacterium]